MEYRLKLDHRVLLNVQRTGLFHGLALPGPARSMVFLSGKVRLLELKISFAGKEN
jgi:hypothetical protein